MSNVVPFDRSPSAEELRDRVRRLAADSANWSYDHDHVKGRLLKRNISMRQVIETLRKGEPFGEPRLDDYGDWRVKLKRYVSGRKVQVVVAVRSADMTIVTVI